MYNIDDSTILEKMIQTLKFLILSVIFSFSCGILVGVALSGWIFGG